MKKNNKLNFLFNKMKNQIVVFLTLLSCVVNAQGFKDGSVDVVEIRTAITLNGMKVSKKSKAKVEGSPYLYKSWNNSAKIYFSDKVYILQSFNYNIYSERFEMKLSEDSVFIINPGNVKMVLINDKVFKRYLDPEFQRNIYFEEIIDFNEYKLLRKYGVIIKEGTLNPLTKQKINSDRLIRKDHYYLKRNDSDELEKIKLNKNIFLNLINKSSVSNIKIFVKRYKLSYKKIDDVQKIFNYYNTL